MAKNFFSKILKNVRDYQTRNFVGSSVSSVSEASRPGSRSNAPLGNVGSLPKDFIVPAPMGNSSLRPTNQSRNIRTPRSKPTQFAANANFGKQTSPTSPVDIRPVTPVGSGSIRPNSSSVTAQRMAFAGDITLPGTPVKRAAPPTATSKLQSRGFASDAGLATRDKTTGNPAIPKKRQTAAFDKRKMTDSFGSGVIGPGRNPMTGNPSSPGTQAPTASRKSPSVGAPPKKLKKNVSPANLKTSLSAARKAGHLYYKDAKGNKKAAVSAADLKKSGFKDLTDFMNYQTNKTRRK